MGKYDLQKNYIWDLQQTQYLPEKDIQNFKRVPYGTYLYTSQTSNKQSRLFRPFEIYRNFLQKLMGVGLEVNEGKSLFRLTESEYHGLWVSKNRLKPQ